ncbi:MAG: tetratricopeptide repeat protein, partial [Anaerolineales bacterium]
MTLTYKSPVAGEIIRRNQFETILRTALLLEEYRFARQAALAWLAHYPGDLSVNLLYAQSLIKAGLNDQAISILEKICQNDPEYLEAVESLVYALTLQQLGSPNGGRKSITASSQDALADRLGWLLALGGSPNLLRDAGMGSTVLRSKAGSSWSRALSKSRRALEQSDFETAETEIQIALGADPDCPLVVTTHLRILLARLSVNGSGSQVIRSLAAFYRQRWSDCVMCTLALAEALMDSGDQDQAVALLHEASTKDITGQVARRLWGDNHLYHALWPADLEFELDIPIPAAVGSALGWNALPDSVVSIEQTQPVPVAQNSVKDAAPASEPTTENPAPVNRTSQETETLRSFQAELERISARLNRPGLASTDGRFPIYVLLTTRRGMEKRFGAQSTTVIEGEMLRLVNTIQQRQDWGALLFYADEALCIRSDKNHPLRLERPAARAEDPWAIKLALQDLDETLRKRGERIGAVLIVGGPEVVPFHHLPNPVDDGDADVPSDNPYGTTDENYFIPEWPVGRLPDSISTQAANTQSFLYSLSGLTTRHQSLANNNRDTVWYRRWMERLISWLKNRTRLPSYIRPSYGYTAAVWKNASINVFRPIGEPGSMYIS